MRAALALLLALASTSVQGGVAALVIDDLGYSRELARRALALPPPVAVAILPGAPYATRIARAAERAGIDTLVHMPMQAEERAAPSAVPVGISRAALGQRVDRAFTRVPGAIGLNNHMGSRLTRARETMDRLMSALAARPGQPLFIDSRTTSRTRAAPAARAAGVPVASRDIFLDHERDRVAIAGQVRRWLERARRTGCALAIGHPHPETLAVLERVLPRADGVRRVDLRTYVAECGTTPLGGASWHASSSRSPKARKSSRPSR